MTIIDNGSTVTLNYSLCLENDTVIDETAPDEPMVFSIGDGNMIAGLEKMLLGMRAGERTTLLVSPDDAFGYHDDSNIHSMERSQFSADMELQPGLVLSFSSPSGEEIPGTILEVGDEDVRVDFNHPLAGHSLKMAVHIVDVE